LRRKWLDLDTSNPRRPHPYRQLASAYFRMGDTLQGRKALYSLEECERYMNHRFYQVGVVWFCRLGRLAC
jgi:hypothetical protein